MIDLPTVIAAIAAAVTGTAGGAAIGRRGRPMPGTPEDHERRLLDLERGDEECGKAIGEQSERMARLEARMQTTETMLAGAIGKLTESTDRQWKAIERLTESVDDLKGAVTRVDVEATIERELRRHAQKKES